MFSSLFSLLPNEPDLSSKPRPVSESNRKCRKGAVAAAALLVFVLAALIFWLHGVYVERENRHRHQAERELQSINQLQLQAMVGWRQQSLRDAGMLVEDTLLAEALGRWMGEGDVEARERVRERLRTLEELGHYTAVHFVDPQGKVRLSSRPGGSGPGIERVPATEHHALQGALSTAVPVMSDPVSDPVFAFPFAGVFAPLYDGVRAIGAVWLVQDLRSELLPLVEPWPTPSQTARSSIVWREGQAARYLNAPRGVRVEVLQYAYPLDAAPTVVTQALEGMRGVFYARDELGREVMAMASPVFGTGWLLVSAVEVAEVFAGVRTRELFALALPVSLLLLAAAGVFVVMLRRAAHRERELMQALQRNLWWLESAQQAAAIGHFAIDPKRGRIQLSALCRQIYGVDEENLDLAAWVELIDPVDRERVTAVAAQLARGEEVKRLQYRIHPADAPHTRRWVEVWSKSMQEGDEGERWVIGVVQDISVRKAVEAELAEHRVRLEAQLRLDPLTGVANRRALDESAGFQLALAVRGGTPLGLLMIDVDHFKAFNDCYGHPAGDQCLKAVAEALQARVGRAGDLVARYGGEEFAVLLPLSDGNEALALGRRLCAVVEALQLPHAASPTAPCVTISIGVAWLAPDASVGVQVRAAGESCAGVHAEGEREGGALPPLAQRLFEEADAALYEAKRLGRNRAILFAAPEPGGVSAPILPRSSAAEAVSQA